MDPYLEHPLVWQDVHISLAGAIRDQLVPRLRPRYVARLTRREIMDETGCRRAARHAARHRRRAPATIGALAPARERCRRHTAGTYHNGQRDDHPVPFPPLEGEDAIWAAQLLAKRGQAGK